MGENRPVPGTPASRAGAPVAGALAWPADGCRAGSSWHRRYRADLAPVLRLLACLVLFYTTRIALKGQVTMDELLFSLKHHWRFLESDALELHALSWDLHLEVA